MVDAVVCVHVCAYMGLVHVCMCTCAPVCARGRPSLAAACPVCPACSADHSSTSSVLVPPYSWGGHLQVIGFTRSCPSAGETGCSWLLCVPHQCCWASHSLTVLWSQS